ncbi:MAG: hypothetical protein ACUVT7_00420 [Thermoplasmata archaeon]
MKERLRLLSRAMQAGMVAVVLAGLITGNFTWIPAALVSLFISEVPSMLGRDLRIVLPVELNFWIVLALFLHVVGGFSGFYDRVSGWDHVTHVLSASLVAALGFVLVVAIDKYVDSIDLPGPFLAFFIVMFTMAFGVIWELLEFGNDQLTGSKLQYSLSDSMVDMMFDAFGGIIVAAAGAHYLTHASPERFVESLRLDHARERVTKLVERRRRAS